LLLFLNCRCLKFQHFFFGKSCRNPLINKKLKLHRTTGILIIFLSKKSFSVIILCSITTFWFHIIIM
jgi:hypothetical protein